MNIPAEVRRWQGPHVIPMYGQPCGICGNPATRMIIDGDKRTVTHVQASPFVVTFNCVR